MRQDYDLIYAMYKEEAKEYTCEKLESLLVEVDKEIDDLKDRHECLIARKKAYKRLLQEKDQR